MEETRRVQLMPATQPSTEKKPQKAKKSIRFNLTLTESSNKTCPEFSYAELARKSLGDDSKPDVDPLDPFGDDDDHDKLVALAMSFEQKYGVQPGKKSKKKLGKLEDLYDLGDGYDESDPFVDNSEAYDELVPESLTTKLGGFYINAGVLDFKHVGPDHEEGSDDDFQVHGKKRKKKKVIGSDSDSDNDGAKIKKMKKKKFIGDGEQKMKKRKKLLSGGSLDGERPLLKKKKLFDKEKKFKKKKVVTAAADLLGSAPQQPNQVNSQVNGAINSNCLPSASNTNGQASGNDDTADSGMDRLISEDEEKEKKAVNPENAPPLPFNLASTLLENIEQIKKAAAETAEGKCKFFSGSVNDMLLSIELACRQLTTSQRTSVFAHLAAFLPCSQQTLTKRAKKLRLDEQDDKLREPIQKLKDAIARVMPGQLERHQQECQAAQLAWQEGQDKGEEPVAGESTEEGDKEDKQGDKEKKRFRMPNKKFEWTDEIKRLLCDVVRIKMASYETTKNKTQSAEDYLVAFLEAEIKPLWPKGWMQTRMLFKQSRGIHAKWTLSLQKTKKPLIMAKTSLPSTPTGSLSKPNLPNPSASAPTSTQGSPGQETAKPRHSSPGSASGSRSPFPSPTSSNDSLAKPKPTLLDYAGESFANVARSKAPGSKDVSKVTSGGKDVHKSPPDKKDVSKAVPSWPSALADVYGLSSSSSSMSTPQTLVTMSNPLLNLTMAAQAASAARVAAAATTSAGQPKTKSTDDFLSMFEQFVRGDLANSTPRVGDFSSLSAGKTTTGLSVLGTQAAKYSTPVPQKTSLLSSQKNSLGSQSVKGLNLSLSAASSSKSSQSLSQKSGHQKMVSPSSQMLSNKPQQIPGASISVGTTNAASPAAGESEKANSGKSKELEASNMVKVLKSALFDKPTETVHVQKASKPSSSNLAHSQNTVKSSLPNLPTVMSTTPKTSTYPPLTFSSIPSDASAKISPPQSVSQHATGAQVAVGSQQTFTSASVMKMKTNQSVSNPQSVSSHVHSSSSQKSAPHKSEKSLVSSGPVKHSSQQGSHSQPVSYQKTVHVQSALKDSQRAKVVSTSKVQAASSYQTVSSGGIASQSMHVTSSAKPKDTVSSSIHATSKPSQSIGNQAAAVGHDFTAKIPHKNLTKQAQALKKSHNPNKQSVSKPVHKSPSPTAVMRQTPHSTSSLGQQNPVSRHSPQSGASLAHSQQKSVARHSPQSATSLAQQNQTVSSSIQQKQAQPKAPVPQRPHLSPQQVMGAVPSSPPVRSSPTSPQVAKQSSPSLNQALFGGKTLSEIQAQMLATQGYQQQSTRLGQGQSHPSSPLGSTSPWQVTKPVVSTSSPLRGYGSTLPGSLLGQNSTALTQPGYQALSLADLARDSPLTHYGTTPFQSTEAALSQLYGRSNASVSSSLLSQSQQHPLANQHCSPSTPTLFTPSPLAPQQTLPPSFVLPFPETSPQQQPRF